MNKKLVLLTMAVGTLAFFAIIGISVFAASVPENAKDLQLLTVIMRHGERTPASTYPNDPYKNDSFAPIGWGRLTNRGKVEVYHTGKFLRERYGKFLGDQYNPEEYYVQATDVDRVKQTVQLVNAGLWPPKDAQKWGPLDWQPIPVHMEPLDKDNLLLVRNPCAQYSQELEKVLKAPEIQAKLKKYQKTFDEVTKLSGQQIKTFSDAEDIYSTLLAEKHFNLTLPEWTKKYFPEGDLLEATIFNYVLNAYNDKLNRLKGGVLLKKLLSDWNAKKAGTSTKKAFLYGGHDSTIANILSTLKVWDPQIPGYGITILMELSKDIKSNQLGLEIYLRNQTDVPPHKLTIPGCDSFCPLDKVVTLTKNVIPQNWDGECKSDDPNYVPPPPGGP